jgi:hypothetical protein
MKLLIFFLLLWVIVPSWIRIYCRSVYGSGSTDLIESESNTDPDPKNPGLSVGKSMLSISACTAPWSGSTVSAQSWTACHVFYTMYVCLTVGENMPSSSARTAPWSGSTVSAQSWTACHVFYIMYVCLSVGKSMPSSSARTAPWFNNLCTELDCLSCFLHNVCVFVCRQEHAEQQCPHCPMVQQSLHRAGRPVSQQGPVRQAPPPCTYHTKILCHEIFVAVSFHLCGHWSQ